jgi:hypothetical protein
MLSYPEKQARLKVFGKLNTNIKKTASDGDFWFCLFISSLMVFTLVLGWGNSHKGFKAYAKSLEGVNSR